MAASFAASHAGRDALVGIGLFLTHLVRSGLGADRFGTRINFFMVKDKMQLPDVDVDAALNALKADHPDAEVNVWMAWLDLEEGWVHLRRSNTEPIIRIYSRLPPGKSAGMAGRFAQRLRAFGGSPIGVTWHAMSHVYLDNAATTPVAPRWPRPCWRCIVLSLAIRRPRAPGRKAKALVETSRRRIAELLNVPPRTICFTSGGTEADNHAIRAAVRCLGVTRIVTSAMNTVRSSKPLMWLVSRRTWRLCTSIIWMMVPSTSNLLRASCKRLKPKPRLTHARQQ